MRILYTPNKYAQQRQKEKPASIYPVLLAMEAQYYRNQGEEVYWGWGPGNFDKVILSPEGLPFLELPHPDRVFTEWWKWQDNGNFKYLPATYIQSARDCWWSKCTFCEWAKKYPKYEVREVDDVISELWEIKKLGFKEVFDDSGTFPIGEWLERFLDKLNFPIVLGCNMRVVDTDYARMASKGFRMLLFGIESANQDTLDRIQKGVKVEDIIPTIKKASECGLEPHIAVMFGYPWETDQDAIRTLKLVHYLLRKGYARTAQASFFTQPGFEGNRDHRKYIRQIYRAGYDPRFWFSRIKTIRNAEDIKYLWKGIKAWIKG